MASALSFGIEIELLLRPREPVANELTLRVASVPAKTVASAYTVWTIADEPSLEERSRYSSQLKSLIKGIIYYDEPVTVIMPADRKYNVWALPDVGEIEVWKKGVSDVTAKTWAPLFAKIDEPIMKQSILLGLCESRYLSWNFQNIGSACGTIEFRRPPALKSATEAIHWISFTLGFVAHSMQRDWSTVTQTNTFPSTNVLRAAVVSGLQSLGPYSQGGLGSMADINEPPTIITDVERARIVQKKNEKLMNKSVFAEKVFNSRPNTPVGAESP
ncbi:conserved hypothetical protein [Histoplasma capsulatum var. duboisii H88]|uniref:Uncharacterized protein n=1 Tax=Ajellomyces capsulatus (strain H88) TaxID=544711 RepID=F0UQB9_AJEC8|nr:conserved hypothetical protein [Histoplasma capsulatum var. duboisii H88]